MKKFEKKIVFLCFIILLLNGFLLIESALENPSNRAAPTRRTTSRPTTARRTSLRPTTPRPPPTTVNNQGFPRDSSVHQQCENLILPQPAFGFVQSPNYPFNYPNNTICYYFITAPLGKTVHLTRAESFNLELNFDFLQVYDGTLYLALYTGSSTVFEQIGSTGRVMILRFSSDSTINLQGFKIFYEFRNQVITTQTTTTTTRTTSTSSVEPTTQGPNPVCQEGFVGDNCEIECGLTYADQNEKIVGGQVAVPHSWPAQALILACDQFGRCGLCGGTLIDRKTVITAAHCTDDLEATYNVYLGLHDRARLSSAVKLVASRVINHPSYINAVYGEDIAILKFDTPVNLTQNIQPACLPSSKSNIYPGTQISSWAVGWGTTSSGGSTSSLLKNVKLTVYDGNVECRNYGIQEWSKQVCAGEYSGGKDTCQGDSGGPLYVLDNVGGKQKYVLAGVTSFGNGCASPGFPGIYTRVSNYLDWVNQYL